jgi:hypothetical protein
LLDVSRVCKDVTLSYTLPTLWGKKWGEKKHLVRAL